MYSIVRSLALALTLTLFAPLTLACSITAAGTCGGSECSAGKTCTKIDEATCKCVKDTAEDKKPESEKHAKPDQKPADMPAKK